MQESGEDCLWIWIDANTTIWMQSAKKTLTNTKPTDTTIRFTHTSNPDTHRSYANIKASRVNSYSKPSAYP